MSVSGAVEVQSSMKEWLEIAYYFAGIVVSIVAVLGLSQVRLLRKQITVAKEDIQTTKSIARTNSRRAAIELAVSENRRFAETCIQASVKIRKFCTRNEVSYLQDILFERTENGFKLDTSNINAESTKKMVEIEEYINELVNGLESYALYFIGGVADEKMGFLSNGKQYIATCELAFKFFPIADIEDDDFEAVKALYFKWRKMLKEKELRLKEKEIKAELEKHKETYVKAIGT
ncbi:hypothetical protein AL536_05745 [Vibrio fluvialis]|uniref:DUF4760 domain-containing protein n=1 Tax=Vibrio fluvialis TaxID=676 RepID=A0AAX2LWD8_VIBFL|nr:MULTISPECIES: hypothetical protein [Vibrio]AMF92960.1 hypothetical protein AL536_05745 [Vibrio fluvialis]EKO4009624.1 hypothetical protein [Vibrio fluvialis]MBY8227930.1 hypothetical protein [Vibrio fluvialis]MCE7632035.1 hypothetical protein [Vibrio fluvialis]OQK43458.1 putative membrane protein [Vibrio vulnificus]